MRGTRVSREVFQHYRFTALYHGTGNTFSYAELGFSYDEVDKLLYLLVDERLSPDECIEAGFERQFVKSVIERVRAHHFKRVMPPIAKLSNRTIGYDFLYPKDWGT